ncbi:MAG: prepilin-type N-terminal cleavage/methylation domain-containing protein [Phycisphaera sp.]|nr:MAG: prepilin-type N-terminal cleavage/methylation domain-containing protein [Phycisphaera sp.]
MTRRGLTLLEVVLATALLALAATGMASIVSSITRPTAQPEAEIYELAAIVDEVLQSPARHDFDTSAVAASGQGSLNIDGSTIQITLKTRSGRGAWLEFRQGEQRIARWVRLPEARL